MYIRWMGAFRKNGSLAEALNFEFTRETPVACEKLQGKKSNVREYVKVGLLVDPSEVFKHWDNDCWSEYDAAGNLYASRPYNISDHGECWAHPVYTGIVIKDSCFAELSPAAQAAIRTAAKRFEVGCYRIRKGKLVKENI